MSVQKNVYGTIYGGQNFEIPAHRNFGKFIIDRMLTYKENIALVRFGRGLDCVLRRADCLV